MCRIRRILAKDRYAYMARKVASGIGWEDKFNMDQKDYKNK